ncbi:hypothetical protein QL285_057629 [Trifolium repens]|nr:hypothetical protein QL285_057629 [Trifolium repens]
MQNFRNKSDPIVPRWKASCHDGSPRHRATMGINRAMIVREVQDQNAYKWSLSPLYSTPIQNHNTDSSWKGRSNTSREQEIPSSQGKLYL